MKNRLLLAGLAMILLLSVAACERHTSKRDERELAEATETVATEEPPVVEEPSEEPAEEPEDVMIAEEPKNTVEEEAEATEDNSEDKDLRYVDLYINQINELSRLGSADRFALIDVDGYDIPELVAVKSSGNEDYNDSVFLYTVYNGEISLIISGIVGIFSCHLEYSPSRNLIFTGGGDVSLSDCFESIEQGAAIMLTSFEESHDLDSSGDLISLYSIGGVPATEEEYYSKKMEYFDNYNPFVRIDYDGMHTLSFEKDEGYINEILSDTKPYMTYDEIMEELNSKIYAEAGDGEEP